MGFKHEWNGTVLTITSDSGTSSANLIGARGPQGIAGNCAEGTGITSIERTSGDGSAGSRDVYTIYLSNGQSYNFEVYNGTDGEGGGSTGVDGVSVVGATVNEGGHLILTLSNDTTIDCGYVRGETGAAGAQGTGITHYWEGTKLFITSASGTSSADLKGEKGEGADIEVDTTPTEGSNKLITSGAVYDYCESIKNNTNSPEYDSGWIVMDCTGSDVTASEGDLTPKYRKIGNRVVMAGGCKCNTDLAKKGFATVYTMPEGFRPTYGIRIPVNAGTTHVGLQISVEGEVKFYNLSDITIDDTWQLYLPLDYLTD